MSISTSGVYKTTETSLTEDANSTDGSTGSSMEIWAASRSTQLDTLVSVPFSFSNSAKYPLPSGVLASGVYTGGLSQEKFTGLGATGEAKEANGDELAGEVGFYYEPTGARLTAKSASGIFSLLALPPEGVTTGADSDNVIAPGDMGVYFSPSFAGLDYEEPDTSAFHDVKYSGVKGTVLDAEGNPVESASLIGSGDAAQTDANGYYSLLAPAGTSTDLAGLDRTKLKSFTAGTNAKADLDWQFAGILIRVQTPDYEPVPGAPVEIGDMAFETNADGEVLYPRAGLGESFDVRVFDNDTYTDTISAPTTEGRKTVVRVGPEESSFGSDIGDSGPWAFDLTVLDHATGRPVRGVSVHEVNNQVTGSTNYEGASTVVAPTLDDGTGDLIIAADSRRYRTEAVEVDGVDGGTATATVRLEPKKQLTQV